MSINRSIEHRICDVEEKIDDEDEFDPIEGFSSMPLVSIDEAIRPLIESLPNIQRDLRLVKEKCRNPSDNLTIDQSASIMIYTIGTNPKEESLYFVLNRLLRSKDRELLKPWFLYLKLFLSSLCLLPSNLSNRTVYRGIRKDFHREYLKKKKILWWSLTSCTESLNTLESNLFLGKTGERTLFTIETDSSIDISKHSFYPDEKEYLLFPGREFRLDGYLDQGSGLHLIQLKEISSMKIRLEPIILQCFYPDGSEYQGEIKGGQRHGQGFYRYFNGEEYRGQWKNDQTNGFGIRQFPSGNRYEGEEKFGKRHGFGISYFSNGDIYQGQWINDQFNGNGIYQWNNHLSFEGKFQNNLKHGFAILKFPSGRIEKRFWINDQLIR